MPARSRHSESNSTPYGGSWTTFLRDAQSGTYRFTAVTDDGMRVKIDGVLVFDKWFDQAAAYTFDTAVAAGNRQVVVDYYEHGGGAVAQLDWQLLGGAVVPQVTGVSPVTLSASGSNQTLTVNGSGFQSGLTVTAFFPGGGSALLSGSQIQNVTGSSFHLIITLVY